MGKSKQKFFTAKTPADITLPRMSFQNFGKPLQDLVPCIVAVCVVNLLKVVQVGNRNPKWKFVSGSRADLPCGPISDGASIR